MLFPSANGTFLALGQADPNTAPGFLIEHGTRARAGTEGTFRFWTLPSHPLAYASGGHGWTSRLHLHPSPGPQRYTWVTQPGYLSDPADVKNLEFTAYVRVHGTLDPSRTAITLKIRGGHHTARAPGLAACTLFTFTPSRKGTVVRFGKELDHPVYDHVDLLPRFPVELTEDTWFGLKFVSWIDPGDSRRVVNRLYMDRSPIDPATGRPGNDWRLLCDYVDVEGLRTGHYTKLADWGGWEFTLRSDGYREIDFAWPSLREIQAPLRME